MVPPPDLTVLELLADELLARSAARLPAALVAGERSHSVVVETRPLDRHDPLAELVGWAPPIGVGAVGVGVPTSVGGPRGRGSGVAAYVCSREGTHLAAWTTAGPPPVAVAPDGPLADVCRRALSLSTPPPIHPIGHLVAVRWLGAVLATTLDRELGAPAPTWPEVVAVHPVVSGDPTLARVGDGAPEAHRPPYPANRSGPTSWGALRRWIVAGHLPAPAVTVQAAAWFDDGSFSRWLLGQHPPLGELWADLDELLPACTLAAIAHHLDPTARP